MPSSNLVATSRIPIATKFKGCSRVWSNFAPRCTGPKHPGLWVFCHCATHTSLRSVRSGCETLYYSLREVPHQSIKKFLHKFQSWEETMWDPAFKALFDQWLKRHRLPTTLHPTFQEFCEEWLQRVNMLEQASRLNWAMLQQVKSTVYFAQRLGPLQ